MGRAVLRDLGVVGHYLLPTGVVAKRNVQWRLVGHKPQSLNDSNIATTIEPLQA